MEKRECVKCGAVLSDEDVIKLVFEDGTSKTIPLSTCPTCFGKQTQERALR